MNPHKILYDRWFQQQSCPPPIQWSGRSINHRGQSAWFVEVSVNGRMVAQSQHPHKEMAENDCAKQLLVHFRVPHD
ncbi:hypothetical protein B0J17DRAFT_717938 [Rhizoctonia solani]|nr:hypothetical protein B0J17DRAFT_717938 [Rhizoctonia solani]